MNKYNDPTAKEMMNKGEWQLYKTYTEKNAGIHVYIENIGDTKNRYRVHRMEFLTKRGEMIFGTLGTILKPIKGILNMVQKELGDELLGEALDEIKEARLARKHRLDIGNSFSAGDSYGSLDEVDKVLEEDVKDNNVKVKQYDI